MGAPFVGAQVTGPRDSPASLRARPTIGHRATFIALAAGSSPLSYQWRLNGTTSATQRQRAYTRTNVQPAEAGGYALVVTNSAEARQRGGHPDRFTSRRRSPTSPRTEQ